jgi:hypothetical protein
MRCEVKDGGKESEELFKVLEYNSVDFFRGSGEHAPQQLILLMLACQGEISQTMADLDEGVCTKESLWNGPHVQKGLRCQSSFCAGIKKTLERREKGGRYGSACRWGRGRVRR